SPIVSKSRSRMEIPSSTLRRRNSGVVISRSLLPIFFLTSHPSQGSRPTVPESAAAPHKWRTYRTDPASPLCSPVCCCPHGRQSHRPRSQQSPRPRSAAPTVFRLSPIVFFQLGQILENIPLKLRPIQAGDRGRGTERHLLPADFYLTLDHTL